MESSIDEVIPARKLMKTPLNALILPNIKLIRRRFVRDISDKSGESREPGSVFIIPSSSDTCEMNV